MKTRSALGLATVLVFPSFTSGLAAPVDFARDIQPLFASRCYECHGERKQKSGFRLADKAVAFRGGDSGKPAGRNCRVASSPRSR